MGHGAAFMTLLASFKVCKEATMIRLCIGIRVHGRVGGQQLDIRIQKCCLVILSSAVD